MNVYAKEDKKEDLVYIENRVSQFVTSFVLNSLDIFPIFGFCDFFQFWNLGYHINSLIEEKYYSKPHNKWHDYMFFQQVFRSNVFLW